MERILKQEEQEEEEAASGNNNSNNKRRRRAVVYLGDGMGDYCPSLKVGEGDYVMPRTGYPVCDLLLAASSPPVRGAVRGWDGFENLGRVLLGIVDGDIARATAGGDVAAPAPECRGAVSLPLLRPRRCACPTDAIDGGYETTVL
jgi:pyridoxal phosphate phosphatase PHOSPHO2